MKNVKGIWLPDHEEHLLMFAKSEGWSYQKHKLDATINFVKKFDVCIDIGGHCGLWSMHLVKLFKLPTIIGISSPFHCFTTSAFAY